MNLTAAKHEYFQRAQYRSDIDLDALGIIRRNDSSTYERCGSYVGHRNNKARALKEKCAEIIDLVIEECKKDDKKEFFPDHDDRPCEAC